jgi:AcrR family transcriptional regulator
VKGSGPVTLRDAATPGASARRLVVTAERLFAQRGIEGVSLRQIAAEAGSANNSAVRYHFGSKGGLITAIFEHRLPQIIAERRLLVSRCDRDDLRSRLEAQMLPVLAMAEATDNSYVSFVEQLQRHRHTVEDLHELPTTGQESSDEFRTDLHHLLVVLPEPLRTLRIDQAQRAFLHAAADRERAVAAGAAPVSFGLFVDCLLDAITGLLTAAPSDRTIQHLDRSPRPLDPGRTLL